MTEQKRGKMLEEHAHLFLRFRVTRCRETDGSSVRDEEDKVLALFFFSSRFHQTIRMWDRDSGTQCTSGV